jgi:hypothetical protein
VFEACNTFWNIQKGNIEYEKSGRVVFYKQQEKTFYEIDADTMKSIIKQETERIKADIDIQNEAFVKYMWEKDHGRHITLDEYKDDKILWDIRPTQVFTEKEMVRQFRLVDLSKTIMEHAQPVDHYDLPKRFQEWKLRQLRDKDMYGQLPPQIG